MPHWTLYKTMMVAMMCVVMLNISLATADVWMERLTGTRETHSPVSRTVIIEAPRSGDGGEGREAPKTSLRHFLSGVIVGLLLVLLLGYQELQGRPLRQRRQRDIDRLIEQFQALFREIDQGKRKRRYP